MIQAHRERFTESRLAPNTLKGYRHDCKVFEQWCERMGRQALPASTETVSWYLADLIHSGRKVTTAVRRTSGISYFHRLNGHASPVTTPIWELLSGAQRMLKEQPRQARPIALAELRAISQKLREKGTTEALRDRSILVLGWMTMLRRGSLAELVLADVTFTPEGLIVRVRFEKTDQQGIGREIGVPSGKHPDTNAAACLLDWLMVREPGAGALYTHTRIRGRRKLSGASIGRAIKLAVEVIGLDGAGYSGHSLRAGAISELAEAGLPELKIASQSGHRSMHVLRKYVRKANLFRSNALHALDL